MFSTYLMLKIEREGGKQDNKRGERENTLFCIDVIVDYY